MSSLINIPQAIEEASKKNPKAIAMEMGGKGYAYEEILSSSKSISSFLSNRGIKHGDRAAIFLEGRPEWARVYLGISFLGAVAVPIDIQLSKDEVINLIQDSGSKAIFISEKSSKNLPSSVFPPLREGEAGGVTVNIDSREFSEILKYSHLDFSPSISPDDIASLIYTSGTTGRPKGVMLTHRNLLSNAESIHQAKIIDDSDCMLSILPFHHSYPFMINFLVPFLTGTKVIYLQSLKGPDILKTVKEKEVTILVGVPQLFEMLRRGIMDKLERLPSPVNRIVLLTLRFLGFLKNKTRINLGRIIFSSVHKRFGERFRFFVSGGAKLDPEVSQDLEALGFTIVEGYGLSETSPVISFNPRDRIKRGSVGLPLSEVNVKIINPDEDGTGEIAIKGPNVMKGYYRNPEETEKVIKDGWFYTGDLGYMDRDGYLYITGRKKEIIVLSSGKNIYPDEIEKHYLQSPLIKDICVLGIERSAGIADTLQAIVVPDMDYMRGNKIVNFNEAVRWEINALSSKLPAYKRIKGYEVYTSPLPRTPLGKLKRYAVLESYESQVISKNKDIPSEEISEEEKKIFECPAGKKVVALLKRLKDKEPIRLDHNLELDLGIDSLSRVELIVSLSQAFSIELPETFGSEIYTVRDLIAKIEESQRDLGKKEFRETSKEWEAILKAEPSTEEQEIIGLYDSHLRRLSILIFIALLRLIAKIFFRLEVKGAENIPHPPYIITPNHESNIDGFVIAIGVPVKSFTSLYFLGFQKYFSNWFSSRFARFAHVIPIDPETYLIKALQISGYVIRKGKAICLFPEGGRTYDGSLMPFKKGVGILSKELGIPLVPTLIQGTYVVLRREAVWPKLGKINVTFGKPIYPREINVIEKPEEMDDYEWIVSKLKIAISEMKKG